MTSSLTWQSLLDGPISSALTDMNLKVYLRVNEAYDLLDLFLANPMKQLIDFEESRTDEVQMVDAEKGEPILEPAPFVPAGNDREQLKAIFKVEVHKQYKYTLGQLKEAHILALKNLGRNLTLPYIPTSAQAAVPRAAAATLAQQRQASRQKLYDLVDRFLNEVNRNLKQFKAKLVEDMNSTVESDTEYLTVDEFRQFWQSAETRKTMMESYERFARALIAMFKEMIDFLSNRIDADGLFPIARN